MENFSLRLLIALVLFGFCQPARYFHAQVVLATSSKEPIQGSPPENGDEICYGVLLNENSILTAAICLYQEGHLVNTSQIALGFKPFDENRIYWKRLTIDQMVVHPGHPSSEATDDIAVLKLAPGSLDGIRNRIVWPWVDQSPLTMDQPTLMVFSFGNIETAESRKSAPWFLEAFHEQPCDDRREACVKSTVDRGSECFGDNGVGLLTADKTLIGIGTQFPRRRIAETSSRHCNEGIEKYTLLTDHNEFIDKHVGNYCRVDSPDRRNNVFLY